MIRRRVTPQVAQSRQRQVHVVPDWGGRDPKLATVRAAVRQLGLDWDAFLAA